MQEKYYNVLAIIHKSNYSKLQKILARHGNWQTAWQSEKTTIDPDKEWEKLQNIPANLLLNDNPDFPKLLKEIPLPPLGIYARGTIESQQPAIAIVGTRKATPQGKEMARSFARALAKAGITIVSGLAMGIDESAHRGALDGGGKTIAVLGTPPDYIYPRQNAKLAEEILENGGGIISEFPIGHNYYPANFLIRNRIISGLSSGILIIEAPERSGSLATARFAIEQNREVFVIPGGIKAPYYQGSNRLLKDGAALVTSPDDILVALNMQMPEISQQSHSENSEEQKIISIFKRSKGNLTAQELLVLSAGNPQELNTLLTMLVIKGIIKESQGIYSLCN